jgi:transposase
MHWVLGIDIAKLHFDAALLPPAGKLKHKRFANTPAGYRELLTWLQRLGCATVHACLEATGTYGEALSLFLYEAGHTVSVVNPKAIVHHAKSKLARTKTDKVDAGLIADYCQKERPAPWTPPAPELRELQALVRRLEALAEMRQMERNRQAAAVHPAVVQASLEAHLTYLEQAIADTKQAIQDHLDQHPGLRRGRDLLLSIPGIGESTAALLLAELGDVPRFRGARQVAAQAGLTPQQHESGQPPYGRTRLCKLGCPRLRKGLYFPALSALRWNEVVREFGARLHARGKNKMVVVAAAMRKLLHLVYGVLKSGKPFDPQLARTGVAPAG